MTITEDSNDDDADNDNDVHNDNDVENDNDVDNDNGNNDDDDEVKGVDGDESAKTIKTVITTMAIANNAVGVSYVKADEN